MDKNIIKNTLTEFKIETPAWAYGDSGTRFKVFKQEESAKDIYEMLERLYDSYMSDKSFNCSLETCRPFTVSVNAAFESCGKINSIPLTHILRYEQGDTVKTVIRNIDSILKVAYENGQLFSETALEWAKQSVTIDTANYKEFKGENLSS